MVMSERQLSGKALTCPPGRHALMTSDDSGCITPDPFMSWALPVSALVRYRSLSSAATWGEGGGGRLVLLLPQPHYSPAGSLPRACPRTCVAAPAPRPLLPLPPPMTHQQGVGHQSVPVLVWLRQHLGPDRVPHKVCAGLDGAHLGTSQQLGAGVLRWEAAAAGGGGRFRV